MIVKVKDGLYSEFLALKEANDGPLLLEMARRILDDYPRASEMLNCCGYIGAVTANGRFSTLMECASTLRRAMSIAESSGAWYEQVKISGNLLMVLNDLGLFHEVADLAERELEVCQRHEKAAIWTPFIWTYMATAHYFNARFTVAAGLLSAALRDDIPFHLRQSVLLTLAMCHARQGRRESARTALELSPRLPRIESWHASATGLVLAAEGNFSESKEAMGKSLSVIGKPGSRYTMLHHAEVYWALAQLEEMTAGQMGPAYRDAAMAIASPISLTQIPLFCQPLTGSGGA